MGIRAITFDFWNTLFPSINANDLRCQQIKQALNQAGHAKIPKAHIEHAIGRAWSEWDRVWEEEQRTFGAAHWVCLVLADLSLRLNKPEQDALTDVMTRSGIEVRPPLIEGVATVLPRLAGQYRLGLICDTGLSPGWLLRQHMQTHGILHYFTYLTFSDELGVSKPHPEAFLTTLARLDVPPEGAVHIGDYPPTDIAGAQGVGMRAIRFAGSRDWSDGPVRADAAIQSYSELEPLLQLWNG
jgi:putative hydrolase of the HAD superfamily